MVPQNQWRPRGSGPPAAAGPDPPRGFGKQRMAVIVGLERRPIYAHLAAAGLGQQDRRLLAVMRQKDADLPVPQKQDAGQQGGADLGERALFQASDETAPFEGPDRETGGQTALIEGQACRQRGA